MRRRVKVPTWAIEELEGFVFEGWELVEVRALNAETSLLVYEASNEREPPREMKQDVDPDKLALSVLEKDALSVAVQQRIEPRDGDVYVVTASLPYRPTMGGVTYLLPAQRLQKGDKIRARYKLSTGVWLFDIASGARRGMFFTVARLDWDTMKDSLRMDLPGEGEEEIGAADKDKGTALDQKVSAKDRNSSPLAKSGSYMRVTKNLPALPVPKKFDTYFAAPAPKKQPPPEGEEDGGGGNPFGRRR